MKKLCVLCVLVIMLASCNSAPFDLQPVNPGLDVPPGTSVLLTYGNLLARKVAKAGSELNCFGKIDRFYGYTTWDLGLMKQRINELNQAQFSLVPANDSLTTKELVIRHCFARIYVAETVTLITGQMFDIVSGVSSIRGTTFVAIPR